MSFRAVFPATFHLLVRKRNLDANMKRIWLVNSTEMEKEKAKRISSKQLEAKITAFTILLAVIVMNILWWTGTQFLE